MMKAIKFIDQTFEKARQWNHGMTPERGVRMNFLLNNLKGKIIIDEVWLRELLTTQRGFNEGIVVQMPEPYQMSMLNEPKWTRFVKIEALLE